MLWLRFALTRSILTSGLGSIYTEHIFATCKLFISPTNNQQPFVFGGFVHEKRGVVLGVSGSRRGQVSAVSSPLSIYTFYLREGWTRLTLTLDLRKISPSHLRSFTHLFPSTMTQILAGCWLLVGTRDTSLSYWQGLMSGPSGLDMTP